jgi:2-dehydro-3-deoxyglucarate aldolase
MMNRAEQVGAIRARLASGGRTIGSWMQLGHGSVAEILGQAGYDWVAIDLEHGAIAVHQLPDLCRALELGGTLPLARVAQGSAKDCKQALEAGAGGVIVPMIESAAQLEAVRDSCRWPPAGTRGVGFSRANLFGKHFDEYARSEAQAPLLVAMVEHARAVEAIDDILRVGGLDAVLMGPYDLSASLGLTAQFEAPAFLGAIDRVRQACAARGIACGVHIVQPDRAVLDRRIAEGYRFLAYSIDAVFLNAAARRPDGAA